MSNEPPDQPPLLELESINWEIELGLESHTEEIRTIPLNNCTGSSELQQEYPAEPVKVPNMIFSNGDYSLSEDGDLIIIGVGSIEGFVSDFEERTGVQLSEATSQSPSLILTANPNTNIRHIIKVIQTQQIGSIAVNTRTGQSSDEVQIPFAIMSNIRIEQLDSQELSCLPLPITTTVTPSPSGTQTPIPSIPEETTIGIEVAVLNVTSEIQPDGTVKYTSQLSLAPLEYGELHWVVPAQIKLGESSTTQVIIVPDSAMLAGQDVSSATSTADDLIQYNDRIQIHSTMAAELTGVNFDIMPSGPQNRPVVSSENVEWLWSITSNSSGKQSLILAITIPVIIDQIEREISAQLIEGCA